MAKKKKAQRLSPTKSTIKQGENTPTTRPKRKKKTSMSLKQMFIFGAVALAMLAFILGPILKNINTNTNPRTSNETTSGIKNNRPDPNIPEPQFRKDGELAFLSANQQDTLQKIDIEIVKDEASITQGLMYRKSMLDNRGMLFVMPQMGPQSFWMKNTYIPLDIIFIDHTRRIVSIQKNTTPFSEKSLPSSQNAKYVLEVNAGYCDKNDIRPGAVLSW